MVSYATPSQPRQLRIELTNACNAHCSVCHRLTMTRPVGYMSISLVQKVLEDAKQFPLPLQEVVGSNYGETFLHPQWHEILRLISEKLPNTALVCPTNGTLLNNGTVQKLATIPNLKLVNLSVNAFLPETYEAFHKLPARNLKVIERAAIMLKRLRPDLVLWISMARDSQLQSPKEVELFYEYWSRFGTVQINQAEFNNRPDRTPPFPVKLPCRSIFSDMAVNWDGRVTTCCYDADCQLVVGDASNDNLLGIWHSDVFTNLRSLHNSGRRGEIALCANCTFS